MKMKKSKFILVPLLFFALILNTIPAFAASSESAAACLLYTSDAADE